MRQSAPCFKEEHWKIFRKRDLYLYFFLFLFIAAAIYWGMGSSNHSTIEVKIDSQVRYRFLVKEDGIHSIESDGKKLMDLLIKQGDVRIIHSQCPLHLCERGTLNQTGVLVCIPQKVIITFEGEEEPVKEKEGIDLITG